MNSADSTQRIVVFPAEVSSSSIVNLVRKDLGKLPYFGVLVLTGSRYFGGVRPDSDWDFFIDLDSLEKRKSITSMSLTDLTAVDFKFLPTSYKDLSISYVCEKVYRIDRVSVTVHLQLVRHAKAKYLAQQEIAKRNPKSLGGLSGLEKGDVRRMWDTEIKRQIEKESENPVMIPGWLELS